VGGLVALAAILRAPTLARAYWIDEAISVGIASHRISLIPGLLRHDGSPPLYYVLLHLWMRVAGAGEVSTHALSLLISLAVIPLAARSARALFGRRAGLCAALLAASSPFLAWYSTETRMYALVCLLALVATTSTVLALHRRRPGDVAGAVLAFAALLYAHNWGLHLVAATFMVVIWRAWRHRDGQVVAWAGGSMAVLVVLYLPWLPSLLLQARHTGAPWAVRPGVGHLLSAPASMLGGSLGALVLPLLVAGVVLARCRSGTTSPDRGAGLLLAIGALTIFAGWLAAQAEPSWASRYLAVALPVVLVAGAGALGASRAGCRVAATVALVLVAWSVLGSVLDGNTPYAKSNVAAVAATAWPVVHPGDLVVVTQTEQLADVARYLPAGLSYSTPLGTTTDPGVVDWRDLVRRLAAADPRRTIAPLLAALPDGAHLFLVNPTEPVGRPGTRWSTTVNRQVGAVNRLIGEDHDLHLVRSIRRGAYPARSRSVSALLFVKRRGAAPRPGPGWRAAPPRER